jgi:site-specific recombinase XerD
VADLRKANEPGRIDEDFVDGLHLGDAIQFFLDTKRTGGRGERTISDYRKKLEFFQWWAAGCLGEGDGAVDALYPYIGADEVESYVVHLRDERGMADSSRKNHLAVLRSFFQTPLRRLEVPDPPGRSTRRCASTRPSPSETTSPSARPRFCSPRWINK